MGTNKKQTAVNKIMKDIKEYVKSIDTPENTVYKQNELLILSCFGKALYICENNLPIEKEQIEDAWDKAIEAHDKRGHNISRSSCDVDDYYEETYNTETDGL